MIQWFLNLTPHELQVLQTAGSLVTGVFGGILIPLLGWGIRLLRANRRDAQTAAQNTQHVEHVDGVQKVVSVTEYARHAAHSGYEAASASESNAEATRDLALWVKGKGRRREPTRDIPTLSTYIPGEPQ